MPFKLHPDAFGSEVPKLDAAVVRDRGKKVRVPGTKGRSRDSILIFDQQLIFPARKVVKGERLLIVEEEQIAIEEQCRSVFVVRVAESLVALVLAKFSDVAPLEPGRLAGRGTTGIDQIVRPLHI